MRDSTVAREKSVALTANDFDTSSTKPRVSVRF